MKSIQTYLNEQVSDELHPKTKFGLQKIILKRIEKDGPECNLNDIDVSNITDMTGLFDNRRFKKFNGDISQWDVSNVECMDYMFAGCFNFNCDISKWDVSKVKYMKYMFYECDEFNCDLSQWNVSNVKHMTAMFAYCQKFNCDLSGWDVSKVEVMPHMFLECKNFRQNLDDWDVSNVKDMYYAFFECPTKPKWYKNEDENEK